MPTYLFIHPDSEEEKEIVQKMDEPHVYIDEKGIEWKRLFTPSNFTVDGRVNPMSSKEFVDKVSPKGNTVGDMQDMAAEMSQKRVDKYGHDPVKDKYFKEYSNKRQGKKHREDPSRYE
tara:strand:- start:106 stop:459 length:354 start_codon:yes stop_codon:yes gene_type:complete